MGEVGGVEHLGLATTSLPLLTKVVVELAVWLEVVLVLLEVLEVLVPGEVGQLHGGVVLAGQPAAVGGREASEGVAHDVETSGQGWQPQQAGDQVLGVGGEGVNPGNTGVLSHLPSPQLLALLNDPVIAQSPFRHLQPSQSNSLFENISLPPDKIVVGQVRSVCRVLYQVLIQQSHKAGHGAHGKAKKAARSL